MPIRYMVASTRTQARLQPMAPTSNSLFSVSFVFAILISIVNAGIFMKY